MAMNFLNLDNETRMYATHEFKRDANSGNVYMSSYFNEQGHASYPQLIQQALAEHNEIWLTQQLEAIGAFKQTTLRQGKSVKVPHTAARTLAECEFNRYYARGLCLRAIDDGSNAVVVYRARQSDNPRSSSEAAIGKTLLAKELLEGLRASKSLEAALDIGNPNSGISVHLIEAEEELPMTA